MRTASRLHAPVCASIACMSGVHSRMVPLRPSAGIACSIFSGWWNQAFYTYFSALQTAALQGATAIGPAVTQALNRQRLHA